MKKKIIASMLIATSLFTTSMSFAATSNPVASPLTLDAAWNEAIKNSKNLELDKKLMEEYKSEDGKVTSTQKTKDYSYSQTGQEIVSYPFGKPSSDYEDQIDSQKASIQNQEIALKKEVLGHFKTIYGLESQKSIELEDLAQAKKNADIAKVKLETGTILPHLAQAEINKLKIEENQMSTLEMDIKKAYRDLNRTLGRNLDTIYPLDITSLVSKVETSGFSFYAPKEAFDFALKNKEDLLITQKKLKESGEDLDRYSKVYSQGHYYYEEKKKTLDNQKYSFDDTKKNLDLEFKTSYQDIMTSLASLDLAKQDLDSFQRDYKNKLALYENGKISQVEFETIKKEAESVKTSYTNTALECYSSILDYQSKYGKLE